jgi:hypothetical protein
MLMAGEDKKIGTVERGGLNAHANFPSAGRRGFHGADSGPVLVELALFLSLNDHRETCPEVVAWVPRQWRDA